jgi:hypothetical protein
MILPDDATPKPDGIFGKDKVNLFSLSTLAIPVDPLDCHPVPNNWVAIWVATFTEGLVASVRDP